MTIIICIEILSFFWPRRNLSETEQLTAAFAHDKIALDMKLAEVLKAKLDNNIKKGGNHVEKTGQFIHTLNQIRNWTTEEMDLDEETRP